MSWLSMYSLMAFLWCSGTSRRMPKLRITFSAAGRQRSWPSAMSMSSAAYGRSPDGTFAAWAIWSRRSAAFQRNEAPGGLQGNELGGLGFMQPRGFRGVTERFTAPRFDVCLERIAPPPESAAAAREGR